MGPLATIEIGHATLQVNLGGTRRHGRIASCCQKERIAGGSGPGCSMSAKTGAASSGARRITMLLSSGAAQGREVNDA
jgi:hypothetical protein